METEVSRPSTKRIRLPNHRFGALDHRPNRPNLKATGGVGPLGGLNRPVALALQRGPNPGPA
jgi:hypothetical protein